MVQKFSIRDISYIIYWIEYIRMKAKANLKSITLPVTISKTIYNYLKKSIIEGEYGPNQRILEKEIAEDFQVSTTPVREAFQRLSAEQYLVINARKEVVVAAVTLNEILELFEVVQVLDAFASANAVPNLTEKDFKDLQKLTDKLDVSVAKKEITSFVTTNIEIHKRIWRSCGNIFLYQSLLDLADRTIFFGNQMFFLNNGQLDKNKYLNKSYGDHQKLMRALHEKDIGGLESLCLSHWGRGYL
jgi:DNA-binding GntR family transcriptional regulator